MRNKEWIRCIWMFILGSVGGFVVETIWCMLRYGKLESRSSLIIGPFTVVYGIGALVLYLGLRHINKKDTLHIFMFGVVAGTLVEYIVSYCQETMFGSVSWDYSQAAFNIGGRVCLLYSVFWGLLALIWVAEIQPRLVNLIDRIPEQMYKPLTVTLVTFIMFDCVLSITAVARWGIRLNGAFPMNTISMIIDRWFPNEFMMVVYPNMRW